MLDDVMKLIGFIFLVSFTIVLFISLLMLIFFPTENAIVLSCFKPNFLDKKKNLEDIGKCIITLKLESNGEIIEIETSTILIPNGRNVKVQRILFTRKKYRIINEKCRFRFMLTHHSDSC